MSFVPLLVITVIAAPPARPCSASKLLVEILTVSIDSAGGTYSEWCGSQVMTLVAPSIRVLFEFLAVPLILVVRLRFGVSVVAFWNREGIAPGTRSRRL